MLVFKRSLKMGLEISFTDSFTNKSKNRFEVIGGNKIIVLKISIYNGNVEKMLRAICEFILK